MFKIVIDSKNDNIYGPYNTEEIYNEVVKRIVDEELGNWIETIKLSIRECSVVIIGNKIDLEDKRMVSKVEGMNMADSFKSKFAEASAKTAEGVEECFKILIQEIYKREREKNGEVSSENLKLTDKKTKESKSLCCGS